MIRRTTRLILAAAALTSFACRYEGAPKPAAQGQGQLEMPAYPEGVDPLVTLRDGEELDYMGSLVLFSKNADPRQIHKVLDAVQKTRLAKADWLALERGQLRPVMAELATLTEQSQRLDQDALASVGRSGAQTSAAERWFSHRLDELTAAKKLDQAAATQAERVFAKYCEAKIWEAAVEQRFVTAKFLARPTPLQLCESHYRTAGFFTGDECAPAADDTGKSYFSCFWSKGAFQTSYFKDKFNGDFAMGPTGPKAAKLEAAAADGSLERALGDENARGALKNSILSQAELADEALFAIDYMDAFVPDSGSPSAESATIDAVSPQLMINWIENAPDPKTPPSLRLLPHREDGSSAEEFVALHQDLLAMAQRPSEGQSISDYLFTKPLAPFAEPNELVVVRKRPAFSFIFDAIPADVVERKNELARRHDELSKKEAELKARNAELLRACDAHLRASASAATLPGTSEALWTNVEMKLKRVGDLFVMRLTLDQAKYQTIDACFDGVGRALSCPTLPQFGLAGVEAASSSVNYAATHGGITLDASSFTKADAFGFALVDNESTTAEGNGNSFSKLDHAAMQDKTIRFELHPNRLGPVMTYYSGKLKVLDSQGKVVHQGGLNLMPK